MIYTSYAAAPKAGTKKCWAFPYHLHAHDTSSNPNLDLVARACGHGGKKDQAQRNRSCCCAKLMCCWVSIQINQHVDYPRHVE